MGETTTADRDLELLVHKRVMHKTDDDAPAYATEIGHAMEVARMMVFRTLTTKLHIQLSASGRIVVELISDSHPELDRAWQMDTWQELPRGILTAAEYILRAEDRTP